MTHRSSFGYGFSPVREACSGAVSGPVRVSYFDPATGEPLKDKPGKRKKRSESRKPDSPYMFPAKQPANSVACTVDGVGYESMRAASKASGISGSMLRAAKKFGWEKIDGHAVSFGESAANA